MRRRFIFKFFLKNMFQQRACERVRYLFSLMPPVDIAALAKDQTLPVLYYCHRVIFAEWTYKVVHGYFLFLQYSSCLTNNLSASSGCAIISNTIFSMRRPCEPFTKIKSPLLIKVFTNTAASS